MKLPVPLNKLIVTRADNQPNETFPGGTADFITIHMTGNRSPGADARSHAYWMYNNAPYSWHATVDDREIWQSLPWTRRGWHAGDGNYGRGNLESIGIEICMHQGIDQERAYENAAALVAWLRLQGHGKAGIVQHYNWTGKNCPQLIREAGPHKWLWFLARVQEYEEGDLIKEQLDELNAAIVKRYELINVASSTSVAGYARMLKAHDLLEKAGIFKEAGMREETP